MKTRIAALLLVASLLSTVAASGAFAQGPQTRSGLLLGIYAYSSQRGLNVTGFIPGYSAQDVLRRGDAITGVASENAGVFSIGRLWDLEDAKEAIGPNRWASIEYYRPGVGYQYAWVQFYPVAGVAAYSENGVMKRQMKAEFRSEAQKPGARQSFQSIRRNSKNNGGRNDRFDNLPGRPGGGDFNRRPGGSGSAADLFRRP